MQTWVRVAASITALALLTACGGGGDDGARAGDPDDRTLRVTVANPSCLILYPLYAGIDQGFFADEDLQLDVVAVDGSGAVLQSLSAGRADLGTPGPGPLLAARAQGADVVQFYNAVARNIVGIWVTEDSGIDRLEDLAGEKLGVGTADGVEVSLASSVLADVGIKDPDFIPVGDGGLAAAAISRGDIDTYVGGVADIAVVRRAGIEVKNVLPDEYAWAFGNGWSARAGFIEDNPAVIESFGRALTRARAWANEHPEETIGACEEVNPEEASDREFAAELLSLVRTLYDPLGDDPVGHTPAESVEKYEESMIASGELEGPVEDLESAFTNEFVEAYSSEGGE